MTIEDSFAYKLAHKRVQLDMTEQQLADRVNEQPIHDRVTEDDVKAWESINEHTRVPDEDVVNALAVVLIGENEHIPLNEKAKKTEEFLDAANRSRAELAGGASAFDLSQPTFGDLLRQHRASAKMTEADLAKKVNEFEPAQIDKYDVLGYQLGVDQPNILIQPRLARVLGLSREDMKGLSGAGNVVRAVSKGTVNKLEMHVISQQQAFVDKYGIDPKLGGDELTAYGFSMGRDGKVGRGYGHGGGPNLIVTVREQSRERHGQLHGRIADELTSHLFGVIGETNQAAKDRNAGSSVNIGWFNKMILEERAMPDGTLITDEVKQQAKKEWDDMLPSWRELNMKNYDQKTAQKVAQAAR